MDVAKFVTRSARRNPSKQYYIVNTAIRAGWIVAECQKSGNYRLYLSREILDSLLESAK